MPTARALARIAILTLIPDSNYATRTELPRFSSSLRLCASAVYPSDFFLHRRDAESANSHFRRAEKGAGTLNPESR
jgi:hypothetical protein